MVIKGNTPLFGINITGYVKGEFGLGESSRAQIRSIKAADIPHTICNIESNVHRSLDSTIKDDEFTTDNPYAEKKKKVTQREFIKKRRLENAHPNKK